MELPPGVPACIIECTFRGLMGGYDHERAREMPLRPPPAEKFSWHQAVIEKVPPLRHQRGSRWPLITWEGFSLEPEAPAYYRQLLERGLAQHIRLDPALIETALAIQRAGSPVIVMEGA